MAYGGFIYGVTLGCVGFPKIRGVIEVAFWVYVEGSYKDMYGFGLRASQKIGVHLNYFKMAYGGYMRATWGYVGFRAKVF